MIAKKPNDVVEIYCIQPGTVFTGIIRPFSPNVYTWVQLKGGDILCWEVEVVLRHVDVLDSYPLVEAYHCYPHAVLTLTPYGDGLTGSDE